MARNKIAEIMQSKSVSGGGTKLPKVSAPKVSTPSISVNGAAAAAPTSAPPATSQISGGAGTPITPAPVANNNMPVANANLSPNLSNIANKNVPPTRPGTQPLYPATQQTSQPGTQPLPNTLGESPLGNYGKDVPPQLNNAVNNIYGGSGPQVDPQEQEQNIKTVQDYFQPDEKDLGRAAAQKDNPTPETINNVADQAARASGIDPKNKTPAFMKQVGDFWNGLDDTQKIGLGVGVPLALIGLFSGASGGNKWLAGALGLAGAAGVGHSMGLFDKIIPGMGEAQEGMKELSSAMEGINQMKDGPEKDFMTRQVYDQALERGGGGFSLMSMLPGTDANRLSSAYNQLEGSPIEGDLNRLDMSLRAHDQLPENHPLRQQVFDQMQQGVRAGEGWGSAAAQILPEFSIPGGSGNDSLNRYAQLAQKYHANKTPEQRQQEQQQAIQQHHATRYERLDDRGR